MGTQRLTLLKPSEHTSMERRRLFGGHVGTVGATFEIREVCLLRRRRRLCLKACKRSVVSVVGSRRWQWRRWIISPRPNLLRRARFSEWKRARTGNGERVARNDIKSTLRGLNYTWA